MGNRIDLLCIAAAPLRIRKNDLVESFPRMVSWISRRPGAEVAMDAMK